MPVSLAIFLYASFTGFAEGMSLFYGMGSPEFTNHIPVVHWQHLKTFRDQQTTSDLVEDFLDESNGKWMGRCTNWKDW